MIDKKLETVVGAVEAATKEAIIKEQKKLKQWVTEQRDDIDSFIEQTEKELKEILQFLKRYPSTKSIVDELEREEQPGSSRQLATTPRKAASDRPPKRLRDTSEDPSPSKFSHRDRGDRPPSKCPWCGNVTCQNLIECGWQLTYKERIKIQERFKLCETCLKPHGTAMCRKRQMRCTYCADLHHVLICPFIGEEDDEARKKIAKHDRAIRKAVEKRGSR